MQTRMLIGGELVAGEGQPEDILNPATGETIVTVNEASKAQVDAAVAAAAAAFPAWSRTTPAERSALLLKLADRIEAEARRSPSWSRRTAASRRRGRSRTSCRRSSTASASSPAPRAACPAAPPASI